jgi:hypothetical protein
MTNHGLTEDDIRYRDRWRNLVLGERKPLQSGQTLDDDDDDDYDINFNFILPHILCTYVFISINFLMMES